MGNPSLHIFQTSLIRKRLNFEIDVIFSKIRKSEQSKDVSIENNETFFRLIENRDYYEQSIIIT